MTQQNPTEINVANITSPYVELFILDASNIGGDTYYFSPSCKPDGSSFSWQGNAYTPMPVTSAGWTVNSDGTQDQPTITLAIVNNSTILGVVKTLGDLVGAKLTRFRTFQKYLDGQTYADPTIYFTPDVYVVQQKTSHDNQSITWSLSTIIDRFGLMLPRRQILRDPNNGDLGFPGVSVYTG